MKDAQQISVNRFAVLAHKEYNNPNMSDCELHKEIIMKHKSHTLL